MLKILLLLCFFISTAGACAPGTGTLGSKGTFSYEMNPPALYTYDSLAEFENGQFDQAYAQRVVVSDVQSAINDVLQANSIPLNDINPPVITFSPPNVTLTTVTECTADTAGYGVLQQSTVYYKCAAKAGTDGKYAKSPFVVPLTVQVTAISAIYESQWKMLASQMADKLTTKRGAQFYTDPIVTVG